MTHTSTTAVGDGIAVVRPAWSPDGVRFVATTDEGIAVFTADGVRIRKLVARGTEPAWQPLPR